MCEAALLAQILSLALAVCGVSSARLAERGAAVPTFQSFFTYSLLAVTVGSWRAVQSPHAKLARPWWVYALLAMLDVQANTLVTKAYQVMLRYELQLLCSVQDGRASCMLC